MLAYIYLAIAIISETIATSALKASDEFTKLIPSLIVIAGYSVAFYFMTLTMRTIPIGIVYAIWSGLGIVLITMVGVILYDQTLTLPTITGMMLIISGVIIIHLYSKGSTL